MRCGLYLTDYVRGETKMGGKMSRNKGAAGEREVCKLLQPIMDDIVKPYREYFKTLPVATRNLVQSRDGGFDVSGIPWAAIEIKRHERVTGGLIDTWWSQAVRQAGENRAPVLLWRKNRQQWRARLWVSLPVRGGVVEGDVDVDWDFFVLWFTEMHTEHVKRLAFETRELINDSCADTGDLFTIGEDHLDFDDDEE